MTQHVRWPSDRFYWGVLDTSAVPRRHRGTALDRQLGYMFERVLPGLQIEQVHAVYRPLPGDGRRYLACGVPTEALREHIDAEAITLSPEDLPPCVGNAAIEPATLNLLTGSFTPQRLRRLNRTWQLSAVALLAILVALVVVRLERTAAAYRGATAALAEQKDEAIEHVLGPPTTGSIPPELRLTAERRRLEQTRRDDLEPALARDCSTELEQLLAHWPADLLVQTESVSVSPTLISVNARVPSMGDAQVLANALVDLSGWRLDQPQSQARRDYVDVALRLKPAAEGAP